MLWFSESSVTEGLTQMAANNMQLYYNSACQSALRLVVCPAIHMWLKTTVYAVYKYY